MKMLNEIKVTAEQIVRDLERLDPNDLDNLFDFSDSIGNDCYLTGVVPIGDGLVALDYEYDKGNAKTGKELLEVFRKLPPSSKIVLLDGEWRLVNLLPKKDGTIFRCIDYYDEDIITFDYEGGDVRLLDMKRILKDMGRFADKYPDRKIVCWDDAGQAHYLNGMEENDEYESQYLVCGDEEYEGEFITVSTFMNADFRGAKEVLVSCAPDDGEDYVLKSIEMGADGVFFEDKVDGEDVVACRMGDTLLDRNANDEEDIFDFLQWMKDKGNVN